MSHKLDQTDQQDITSCQHECYEDHYRGMKRYNSKVMGFEHMRFNTY